MKLVRESLDEKLLDSMLEEGAKILEKAKN